VKRSYTVIAVYALLALLVIPVYPHFVSPNEFARLLLDASIVELRTIEVTRLAPALGPRFEDLAVVDGRLYSNKAPGTTLFTLPGYALARLFTTSLRGLVTAMRVTGATLPLLLLALLFVRLARRREIDDARTATVLWLLLFATPLFAYGLLIFSHALVAAALWSAWYFLYEERRDLLAGALLGIAVSAEYPMAVPALMLIAPLLRDWRRALRIIAGGAPFALALAAYHTAAFGSPFANPYRFSKLAEYQQLATGGLFGIHLPSPVGLFKLLLDPTYGLLVFSPVLVMGVMGLMGRMEPMEPMGKAGRWMLIVVPAAILLIYAGYPYWHGGWNVGPRYLVPVIPFLVAPLLFRNGTVAEMVLGGAGALAVVLTTLVFPFVPEAFAWPWMSLAAPLLGEGLVAPNLVHWIARPLALLVPFAIVVAASCLVFRRRVAYALVGVLLAIAIGARSETPRQRIQRDYIGEVYFERHGMLRGDAPPGLLRRRDAELVLPPASWPF
jgi:hypothetical protein